MFPIEVLLIFIIACIGVVYCFLCRTIRYSSSSFLWLLSLIKRPSFLARGDCLFSLWGISMIFLIVLVDCWDRYWISSSVSSPWFE